ncbi:MAG: glycosyltransferase family 2 protein [Nitrososphaerota archaeon]|nr:glycosyltransferase family 2 protein [Nitrososphaerota archaeon]
MELSVLILTRNEQHDLPKCLDSVSWCQDIHVLDSFSEDKTVEIARRYGAHVTQHKFEGYASQRNFGLHEVHFKNQWVLMLDADERVPPDLAREIQDAISSNSDRVAYRIRRRDYYMKRELKHAQISPWFIRLVRPAEVYYEREVNEVLRTRGQIGELRSCFDHYPFSKGLDYWIDRHNRYSTMEAEVGNFRASSDHASVPRGLFSVDPNERRRHQKKLFYRLPFRPLLKFCYMTFVRGAFLDGRPGIRYAVLQSIYEYFIVLKQEELNTRRSEEGV